MDITLDYAALEDRRLVELHLNGDRWAFRQIVERHQAMVCALSVSACGDVGRSEDLAQEVFVAAWRQMARLREPEKLRAWLAGIARHQIADTLRRQRRVPTARAEPLSPETATGGEGPDTHAARADEAALLWRSLEAIPEKYREPMVLFYREQRSAAAVAAALDLSEETVRQRLVRGRSLLGARLATWVEETLEQSAPSPAFVGKVLLALPAGAGLLVGERATAAVVAGGAGYAETTLAAAAGAASVAAKGGLAVKAVALVGLVPILLGGVMDLLKFRAAYGGAASAAHRRALIAEYLTPFLSVGILVLGILSVDPLVSTAFRRFPSGSLGVKLKLAAFAGLVALGIGLWMGVKRWRKQMRAPWLEETRVAPPDLARPATGFEYRSRVTLLGLPLLHVRIGGPSPVMRRTARGWIAVSDGVAWGGLAAVGGQLAVAPVSVGGGALGVVSVGGLSFGLGAVGLAAAGGYAFGGLVFGWTAAQGAIAVGGDYAVNMLGGKPGAFAWATHANDAAAWAFVDGSFFFQAAMALWKVAVASAWFMWLPPLVLVGGYLWRTRARR